MISHIPQTALSSGGEIVCKEYGKAKIYFMDQNKGTSCEFTDEEVSQLEAETEDLKQALNKVTAEEKALSAQLAEARAQPSDQDLFRCEKGLP